MVALTGELGEPPARILDLWRLDELRGIAIDGGRRHHRRPDDLHRDPPLERSAASTCRRWSRRPRRSARPRSRTAARSAATSRTPRPPATRCRSCWRPTRRSCSARCAASERSRPRDFWPAYRRTALAPDELLAADPDPADWPAARCASARSARGARSRSARSCWPSAWRDGRPARCSGPWRTSAWRSAPWPPRRSAPRPRRRRSRAARPTPETADLAAETLAGELQPIDDVRSTAEYRRLVAARVLHRLIREAGGW